VLLLLAESRGVYTRAVRTAAWGGRRDLRGPSAGGLGLPSSNGFWISDRRIWKRSFWPLGSKNGSRTESRCRSGTSLRTNACKTCMLLDGRSAHPISKGEFLEEYRARKGRLGRSRGVSIACQSVQGPAPAGTEQRTVLLSADLGLDVPRTDKERAQCTL
jgi:hypothetical protein